MLSNLIEITPAIQSFFFSQACAKFHKVKEVFENEWFF